MNIYEKLALIQQELKAPKGQYNSFGKYKYRSCEDILEAVKPICAKYKTALVLLDDIKEVSGRFYVMAQAQLYDCEENGQISASAFAREPVEKKGMDDSQITGTASSYARKYALNGLFCIDDTKDSDTDEYRNQRDAKAAQAHSTSDQEGFICERCQKPITPIQKRDGTTWEAHDMATYSWRMFGAQLCGDCMKQAKKEQNHAG